MRIYVGNLPYSTDDSELDALFSNHGNVAAAEVVMERGTGRSRGFGFVEMQDDGQAQAAMDALNGKEFEGRQLVVNEARARPARDPGRTSAW